MFGQRQKDYFTLSGRIQGNYRGYLYLDYNGKKRDSCLVVDNHFYFKGKVPYAIAANFTTNKATLITKEFYLENEDVKMTISIEKKIINAYEFDHVVVNEISGTKTSLIDKDYEDFKNKNKHKKNWQTLHYKKLDEIVSKYPKHQYTLEILTRESYDSIADIQKLLKMYNKLDFKSLDSNGLATLKRNIFPIESSKVGKMMMDFELFDKNDKAINTNQYRNSILYVDFWASWCAPCRKQIPEISKLHEKYKDKNFKILSVSLDKSKEKWLLALKKEKMQWDNVIDRNEFKGKVADAYGIHELPTSFLIDEKGIILLRNPTVAELEKYIDTK